MSGSSILIVEDESVVALDLKLQLLELGYAVPGIAASAEQAIAQATRHQPDLVLMDVRLQGAMDGIEAAEVLRKERSVPVIFLTSHSDSETVARAARTAPYGYLTKPYQLKELRAGIEVALTKARMERQLQEADRWFAHTLNCVQDGVVVTELNQKVRFLNPAAEKLTGWTQDDAVGREIGDIVQLSDAAEDSRLPAAPPSSSKKSLAPGMIRRVMEQGRPSGVSHDQSLVARDHAESVVDSSAGPVNDDTGRRLGAVLVLRDASVRLTQEASLRASEERFRSAFDFAPLGMALVSMSGHFIQVNDSLCKLLEIAAGPLREKGHAAVSHLDDRAHEAHRLEELRRNPHSVVQFEKRYLRADGSFVWALVSVSLLREGGQTTCYLYQIHDLTEQKRAAEHVAELASERMRREASDMANKTKSEFLSRVSHEMRTPLNAVMGFAQLLKLQTDPDPVMTERFAKQILSAGEHLLAMVNDLLDLQRAAQGSLKLALEAVDLRDTVDVVHQFLQGQADARQIALKFDIPMGVRVWADPIRLRQVLLNIGSNAIKYNRAGGTVSFNADRLSQGGVRLLIEDSGIGMTPEQLARLFQPFDRLGQERTATPGTGLGFVIARDLVLEMGGTLDVSSQARAGTRVVVSLRDENQRLQEELSAE